MDKQLLRITLYATVIYLTGGLLASAVASPAPLWGNGTHSHGHRDLKGLGNRNYARNFANLNVGEPRTVRMIYLLPNDRPYRADVVQLMKDEIRTVQTFFADQMEAHGYGKMTFRFETDSQGEPMVHRVDGQYPESHYYRKGTAEDTVAFDLSKNIYLILVDSSVGFEHAAGYADNIGKQGGFAVVTGGRGESVTDRHYEWWWQVVAHELGHAFGLGHDFRDETFIMSYGAYRALWRVNDRLSACSAAYLSVHSYFNPDTPIEEGPSPRIELISPRSYPASAKSISIRVKVSDPNGLHQVILSLPLPDYKDRNRDSVKACRELGGKKEAVIEFDYDGVIPSAHDPSYSISKSLLNFPIHPIRVEAIDTDGNTDQIRFNLFPETLQPLSKISGDNQHGWPNRPLPVPFVVEVRELNDGSVRETVPVTFTVTAGSGRLSVEHTETDDYGRAESTLTLGPNLGTTTVTVSAAGIEGTVTFTAMTGAPVEIPDPNLRAAIENALGEAPGALITPADMASLTEFEARPANIRDRNAKISDLTGLEYATNLTSLELSGNAISDISAVSSLTNLTELELSGNNITDISPLAGLPNLIQLWLSSNAISDISVVSGLTNLIRLSLSNNNITDISPLAGLTNLRFLYLGGNNITDISAVSGLTNLVELRLNSNPISDISAVSGLTNLIWLSLSNNNITDLSPLVANTGLGEGDRGRTQVYVRENPLSYVSIYTHIPTLRSRGVRVGFDSRRVERLLKISSDNQQGTVGEVLADPFVVEVRDENGEVFAEVPVTFTVTAGSGTLNVTSTTTDENGRAQSTLTLGPDFGPNTVSVSAAGTEVQVIFNAISSPPTVEYLWSIPSGLSLIHVPLKVTAVDGVDQTVESISDLYDALGGALRVNFLITYDSQTQDFRTYFGASDSGTSADVDLTDDIGIIAGLKTPVMVQLTGEALGIDGNSTVTLHQGLNLVGLPLNDSSITRVSDLFALDGIQSNVPVIILTEAGDFQSVGRAGDPSDVPITGGQGFLLTAQQPATVTISGEAWSNVTDATSPIAHKRIEVRDTTTVLALRGAVVDEETDVTEAGFRVTAKNLSTGRTVAGMTEDEGVGYRLAVVDIETGRAATIGDTLEISAQSPHPFIGVKPLRYTVSAEDVRQSLIQLPELVAYEIPAETQLLANYPNPFNPETWIPYRLAADAIVTLTIYDLSGQVVRALDVGHQIAAVYESRAKAIYWDGRNGFGETVASGVYFYHLSAGDYSATRKMLILK